MNLKKALSVVKAWENKISEKCPLKTILAICVIVILWQLEAIRSDVSSINRDISSIESEVSSIESDVSRIESNVSSIESDVSRIKRDVSRIPY